MESPNQQHTEACAILYTQIEGDKDPLHIMFLINECMATLTGELPRLQKADEEDMAAIKKYATTFEDIVTDLRNTGNDAQGHFGGKKIQVGDKEYESLAARTHNEFVNRVDKEMSSLYSWMKDSWSHEPILDWAGQEVNTDFDEEGNSNAFKDADVESSKAKHTMLEGRDKLLNKARQRGWGKSHIKQDAAKMDAYKDSYNIHNQFKDLRAGDYRVTATGCLSDGAVMRKLQVTKSALCPSVKLGYTGSATKDEYTFTVENKGFGSASETSEVTLPKTIKEHLTDDRPPVYKVSKVGCETFSDVLDILAVPGGSNDCDKVKLEWNGKSTDTDYKFKVSGIPPGGGLQLNSDIELKKAIKDHLSEA
jgi:hypothetical protein